MSSRSDSGSRAPLLWLLVTIALPADLRGPAAEPEATGAADAGLTGGPFPDERRRITELLQSHRGNRSEVARLLGISRTTLWRRMKQHGIADIR